MSIINLLFLWNLLFLQAGGDSLFVFPTCQGRALPFLRHAGGRVVQIIQQPLSRGVFWHEYAKIPKAARKIPIAEGDFYWIFAHNCEEPPPFYSMRKTDHPLFHFFLWSFSPMHPLLWHENTAPSGGDCQHHRSHCNKQNADRPFLGQPLVKYQPRKSNRYQHAEFVDRYYHARRSLL